jgi:hypothetical protein
VRRFRRERRRGRWIDAHEFVVAQFLQRGSRDRDPEWHVHDQLTAPADPPTMPTRPQSTTAPTSATAPRRRVWLDTGNDMPEPYLDRTADETLDSVAPYGKRTTGSGH